MSEDYAKGVIVGRDYERERIITLSKNKVCFDNRDKGECEHSVCYGMLDLIALIKNENAT
jgi:hypothetical protein